MEVVENEDVMLLDRILGKEKKKDDGKKKKNKKNDDKDKKKKKSKDDDKKKNKKKKDDDGKKKKKKKKSKGGPVCSCGAIRSVASKNPSRALPCSECGADACDVDEL